MATGSACWDIPWSVNSFRMNRPSVKISYQKHFLPGGGRAWKQGRQHDGHGPGRHHPAPWTTIKYRVSGSTLGTANQSAASSSRSSLNTLSNLYPRRRRQSLPRTVRNPGGQQPHARPLRQHRFHSGRGPERRRNPRSYRTSEHGAAGTSPYPRGRI